MDDTRERILNSAGEAFAAKGFEHSTIREICGHAKANIAAVNYHFRDKQSLYLETVKAAHCSGAELPDFGWGPDTPPEKRLFDFIRHMMEDMLDDDRPGWQVPLLMREMARPSQACEELVRSFIGPKFQVLLGIVSEFLGPTASQQTRYRHTFSVVSQCLLYRFHRAVGRLLVGADEFQRLSDVQQLAEHVTQFSLAGLRAATVASVPELEPTR